MIITAGPAGGATGWPDGLSHTATREPAAAPEMAGTVTVVSTPDRSPPGDAQRAWACPTRGKLPAGGPDWVRTATAGWTRAAACCDWYVCTPTMAATATATAKTAVSATRTAPSNLSMRRLSGLRPASIRASRDIRPVATRGIVSDPEDGMAKLLRAHRDIAVGLMMCRRGPGRPVPGERVVRGVRNPAGCPS